jgi:hypothetical protein
MSDHLAKKVKLKNEDRKKIIIFHCFVQRKGEDEEQSKKLIREILKEENSSFHNSQTSSDGKLASKTPSRKSQTSSQSKNSQPSTPLRKNNDLRKFMKPTATATSSKENSTNDLTVGRSVTSSLENSPLVRNSIPSSPGKVALSRSLSDRDPSSELGLEITPEFLEQQVNKCYFVFAILVLLKL